MGLIIAGLFTLTIALLAFWAWSLNAALRRDRQEAAARKEQDEARAAQEAREQRLRRPGERLYCLGCGHHFAGPLPDTGCPHCHLAALVVLEEEKHCENR